MNIWILTSEMPNPLAGGIARYVENFAKILGQKGHQVTIISKSDEEIEKEIAKNVTLIGVVPKEPSAYTGNFTPLNHPAFPYNILTFWDAFSYQIANKVLKLLKNRPKPDIIETQEYSAVGYYLLQKKLTKEPLLADIPILVHIHSPWFETAKFNEEPLYKLPYYWVGQMEKFCIHAADALISPSRFVANSVKESLKKELFIETFPLPTAIKKEDIEIPADKNILYFGRLEIRKGVLPLIESSVSLWKKGEDFKLTLIGGDTDYFPMGMSVGSFIKQKYRKWIEEEKRLVLKPQKNYEELLREIKKSWAVIIPSLWENFPNTCIEAMSLGKVVLASKNGGQAEMIEKDGENGFIFDWKSGDFEEKLLKILSLTKKEIEEIGKKAQERIYDFCDPKKVYEKRISHFKRVIENHHPKTLFPTTYEVPKFTGNFKKYNQKKDLLSVVIPYYNLGSLLNETIQSILDSTYKNLEIIIVNDGSSDKESIEVLKKIERENNPKIKIIHTENQGLATARNKGAKEANGEFLAFVDADDLIDKEFFKKAIEILKSYENVSFVYSWVEYFGSLQDVWPTYNAEFPYLLAHNMINANLVLKYEEFMNKGLNKKEMKYGLEDYEAWINILANGGVGVAIPEVLVRYRIREDSMYRKGTKDQIYYLYERITNLHPSLYQKYGAELFNLQNQNGSASEWIHPSTSTSGLAWREYELGAKIVKKIKNNPLIKLLLKNPKMKERMKEVLKKIS
ncbi:MAG: glycosyltransferase [Epsilonproteobacteria bacterium]|nr:glycosyltransferase [Campylobacterota bacterium]